MFIKYSHATGIQFWSARKCRNPSNLKVRLQFVTQSGRALAHRFSSRQCPEQHVIYVGWTTWTLRAVSSSSLTTREIICFHVRPSVEAEVIAKFVIECEADAKISHYPLELRGSRKDTPEMPFPDKERPPRKERQSVRPALSREEGLRLSDKELLDRGYPPRPDPKAVAPFKTGEGYLDFRHDREASNCDKYRRQP